MLDQIGRVQGTGRDIPLIPVLSGSIKASVTFPFSTTSAYRLLRWFPNTVVLSKVTSRASENLPVGSPRKRIYKSISIAGIW